MQKERVPTDMMSLHHLRERVVQVHAEIMWLSEECHPFAEAEARRPLCVEELERVAALRRRRDRLREELKRLRNASERLRVCSFRTDTGM